MSIQGATLFLVLYSSLISSQTLMLFLLSSIEYFVEFTIALIICPIGKWRQVLIQDVGKYLNPPQKVLRDSIGSTWNTNFSQFEPIPIAAASIGQVHRARLAASVSPSGKEEEVAVKV